MKALFILNDPPYGTERTYNGLRLANNVFKKNESAQVTIFLMGDGSCCLSLSGSKSARRA